MPNLSSLSTNFFPTPREGFTTTTSSSVASGAATVPLNSTTGYTNGDVSAWVVDPVDASKKQVFTGTVNTASNQIENVVWTEGTNQTHAAGATVVDYVTATHMAMVTKGITQEHNQSGTHGAITATSITAGTGTFSTTFTSPAGFGILKDIRTYTASTTWSKPTGLKFVIVEVQGGGGGGGGSNTTNNVVGSGGGGGGYSFKKVAVASLGATETVTIGAAGAAGTSTGNGGAGGNSSFGAHAVGNGGGGGSVGGTTGGAGGTATSGDLNIPGQNGTGGGLQNSTVNMRVGFGGDSKFGFGGVKSGSTDTTGEDGKGYGSGGSGGLNNAASRAGGAGTAGLVMVWEFL